MQKDKLTKSQLFRLLKTIAKDIGIDEVIEFCSSIRQECRYVNKPLRERYIKLYTQSFMDPLMDLKSKSFHSEEKIDLAKFIYCVRRLFEMQASKILIISVLYFTFVKEEPFHPIGTPFPGGFIVRKKKGVFYCPVKEKQEDNKNATCDMCVAFQDPKVALNA